MKFIVIVYAEMNIDRIVGCLITSNSNEKITTPGCHPKTNRFLIPMNNEGFISDTYLELLRFKEWNFSNFSKAIDTQSISFDRKLTGNTMEAIKECYTKIQRDTPSWLYPLLIT